ncbi:MAG: pantothenate kinase [Spirochaetaceae bacterium 4572_59]|nr:MAG: pantothenate kinase [Spirochaetaceae bacterium 4572_59]
MLLAVDIGNTNIVLGIHNGESWINHWRICTDPTKMPDEYGVLLRDLLRQEDIHNTEIKQSVISSVVPGLTPKIRDMIQKLFSFEALIVGPGVKTGLKILIENPAELGTDIVCNSVAAYNRIGGSCIVVDFGTALTFTAIREPGEILGVSIAPGLQAAAEALSEHTAQLPQVWLEPPKTTIGTNTNKSIQSGVIFGYTGLVEALIDRMKEELGGQVSVIGTGGRSGVIAPLTDRFTLIEPWLILEGLRLIASRNTRFFENQA